MTRLHWDMTSVSLHGDYDDAEPQYARPRFGHPKDRRPDLKQVQAGIAVSSDGAIPVFHRAYDDAAGEVGQVIGAMQGLQKLAGPQQMLMIGDSKLVSYANLAAMIAGGVDFIAPASKHYVSAETLAGQKISAAIRVDYVAARDEGKPIERRAVWHVRDDVMTLAGPRKKDPVLTLRRIFVHSSARAQAAEAARAKKPARAGEDLARLERGLGSRHYPTQQAVTDRITAIGRARRVSAYLSAVTGTDPDTGKPTHLQLDLLDLLDIDPRDLRRRSLTCRKRGLAGRPDLAMAYGRRATQLVQQVREQRAALLQPPLPAAFGQPRLQRLTGPPGCRHRLAASPGQVHAADAGVARVSQALHVAEAFELGHGLGCRLLRHAQLRGQVAHCGAHVADEMLEDVSVCEPQAGEALLRQALLHDGGGRESDEEGKRPGVQVAGLYRLHEDILQLTTIVVQLWLSI
ncbi:hypothetical protein OIE67_24225 [Nonomuraea fuscirosea]|nr:hypothetical protein [Nonomuraea fuscirosea]WSA57612.1 hypothetical protein OIE67_24225 [Nonomuraea fuscirosea]